MLLRISELQYWLCLPLLECRLFSVIVESNVLFLKMVGSIGSVRSVAKVGRQIRLRRLTREQIERLMVRARKTWVSVNEVLKNGRWNKEEKEC